VTCVNCRKKHPRRILNCYNNATMSSKPKQILDLTGARGVADGTKKQSDTEFGLKIILSTGTERQLCFPTIGERNSWKKALRNSFGFTHDSTLLLYAKLSIRTSYWGFSDKYVAVFRDNGKTIICSYESEADFKQRFGACCSKCNSPTEAEHDAKAALPNDSMYHCTGAWRLEGNATSYKKRGTCKKVPDELHTKANCSHYDSPWQAEESFLKLAENHIINYRAGNECPKGQGSICHLHVENLDNGSHWCLQFPKNKSVGQILKILFKNIEVDHVRALVRNYIPGDDYPFELKFDDDENLKYAQVYGVSDMSLYLKKSPTETCTHGVCSCSFRGLKNAKEHEKRDTCRFNYECEVNKQCDLSSEDHLWKKMYTGIGRCQRKKYWLMYKFSLKTPHCKCGADWGTKKTFKLTKSDSTRRRRLNPLEHIFKDILPSKPKLDNRN